MPEQTLSLPATSRGQSGTLSRLLSPPDRNSAREQKRNLAALGVSYAGWGFLVGLFFPGLAWVLDLTARGAAPGLATLAEMHAENSLHYIIDTAPLVLALFAYRLGLARRALVERSMRLSHEVRSRTRKLAESEARSRAVIDNAADGIVCFNNDGKITEANPAAGDIFGCGRSALVGRSIFELVPPLDDPERMLETTTRGLELRGVRDDGSDLELEVNTSLLERGESFVAVLHDVSARRALERAKDEFLAVVSHELRTPLTSIRGAIGLLRGGVAGELSEQSARLVSLADANARRLGLLINDLLDLGKLDAGQTDLTLQRVEIADVVTTTLGELEPLAASGKVTLTQDIAAAAVTGDANRLVQVLTNLTANALKHSPEGTTVSIRARTRDDHVRVEVCDEGPGIAAHDQPKLFQKFSQLDSSDQRHVQGSGLGLVIAKRFVELHGGRIGVISELGAGATFWFELPLAAAESGLS